MSRVSLLCHTLGFFIAMMPAVVFADTTLKGLIVRDRKDGPVVAGLPVTALGASPALSGNDGVFVLTFKGVRPGEKVSLKAGDKNWEVVNDELLHLSLPAVSQRTQVDVVIVVARPSERLKRREEYFGLIAREATEATHRKKVAELEQRLDLTAKEGAQEREMLKRQLNLAEVQNDLFVKQLAQNKTEDSDGVYGEALRLYSQGQSEQALELLSEPRLEREGREAQDKLQRMANAWQLKGNLLMGKFEFAGAQKAFEQATKVAPGLVEPWSAYGFYSQMLGDYRSARRAFERALILAREGASRFQVATALIGLGMINKIENRALDARQQLEEALRILEDQPLKSPTGKMSAFLVLALSTLGDLNVAESRPSEARKMFEGAMAIARDLATEDSVEAGAIFLVLPLDKLAMLNRAENRFTEARRLHDEALRIVRVSATKEPTLRLMLAQLLGYIGELSRDENRDEDAKKQFEEALQILRDMAKAEPTVVSHASRVLLARVLTSLGNLSVDENRFEKARRLFQEALNLYLDSDKNAPGRFSGEIEQLRLSPLLR